MATGSAGGSERRLSTGHEVELPLSCRARLGGCVLAADWAPLRAALPRELTPVRLGPRSGAVALVGIDYHEVGTLEPYREFAVVVPTATDGIAGIPTTLSGVGGHVVDLPVSTEPARALGDEVWGVPKSVTDITVETTPETVTVTVDDGGRPDIELSVDVSGASARRVRRRLTATAFLDDRLVGVPVDIDAEVRVALAGGPGGNDRAVRLARGDGRYACVLRDLGIRPRVYARFVASLVVAAVHPPEAVD